MCGIFLIFNKKNQFSEHVLNQVLQNFNKIKHRGPDKSTYEIAYNCFIGFHRLAINDLTDNGMQPFITFVDDEKQFTICNGEIYNYEKLLSDNPEIQPQLKSHSDCEILPYLYNKYGFYQVVEMIDGVFATCFLTQKYIYLATDRIGVKPLFYAENDNFFAICSEAKGLDSLFTKDEINRLSPGTVLAYNLESNYKKFYRYWSIYDNQNIIYEDFDVSVQTVKNLLINAVRKRMTTDREIGCLLSGGLDSSCIAAILSKELKKQGKKLSTFSVGFHDSTDLKFARQVANFIDSDHHELIISYDDALNKIPEVIKMIETYDTTTVRASTPMYMLCEWINKNFPHKVIFSGEGSDELFGGYLYFHNAPSPIEGHKETLRLVDQLYQYDVLRADRCTAGNGLEFREPFLDYDLVNYVSRLDPTYKIPKKSGIEKTIIRLAFANYLPDSVLWRVKQAFSDAVSNPSVKPWYKYIQEHSEKQEIIFNIGTLESKWYRTIFFYSFKNYLPDIPLWLPKWVNVGSEPSATILNVYTNDTI